MNEPIWMEETGEGPLAAVALHDGHGARAEVGDLFALADLDRLREEDPFTGSWTRIVPNRWVALRSRFEVDLNRPRERAVYRKPADAWGLEVWSRDLPEDVAARSLEQYDACYDALRDFLRRLETAHGRFVVFDIHTYNHRRSGPDRPAASGAENPQVNLGTGTLDRARWGHIAERFMADLAGHDFPGGPLDVRENVKFRGGHFSRWVHETFPETGCALAIEFKKFFMDEWTGEPDTALVDAIREALSATVPGVLAELKRT